MGSIKIQNVFAYLNIYLYSLAICRCSSMLFCFYSARKIDRKWWVTPPPPSSCDPGFPRRRNLAPKVSFNVRSITRTISASCGDGPQRNQGENHTKKRNNERKTLHPILFALSDFFLPFLFFVVFFVIGCVYLTNIKHIFTPDDDAIIIVLIVFAGESKVQTSINKNNIFAGVKNKDLLWRVGVSPCPIVGLSRVPRVPAPQSAVLGPSSVCHFANICQSRKTLLAVAKKQGG